MYEGRFVRAKVFFMVYLVSIEQYHFLHSRDGMEMRSFSTDCMLESFRANV